MPVSFNLVTKIQIRYNTSTCLFGVQYSNILLCTNHESTHLLPDSAKASLYPLMIVSKIQQNMINHCIFHLSYIHNIRVLDTRVRGKLGTGTVGYSDRRVQMRQLGTGTIGYRSWRQLGTGTIGYKVRRQLGTGTNGYKWCDKHVQGQTDTSVTNGWVQGQSGTSVTKGYRDNRVQGCDKRVQGQTGTSATNWYSDNWVPKVRQTGTATIGYK